MANIPLKTIKFPGLDDTYTVPQIDSSFTGVAGEAPDSNKVKGEIDSLKEDLNSAIYDTTGDVVSYKFTDNHWINTSSAVDVTALESKNGWACAVIECAEGDVFTITGKGSTSSHYLYSFVDSDGAKLQKASSNETATDKVITAPANTTHLVLNVDMTLPRSIVGGKAIKIRLNDLYTSAYTNGLADKGSLNSNIDINNVTVTGLYSWTSSNVPINAPYGSLGGKMLCFYHSSSLAFQMVVYGSGSFASRFYLRSMTSAGWTEWEEFKGANTVDTYALPTYDTISALFTDGVLAEGAHVISWDKNPAISAPPQIDIEGMYTGETSPTVTFRCYDASGSLILTGHTYRIGSPTEPVKQSHRLPNSPQIAGYSIRISVPTGGTLAVKSFSVNYNPYIRKGTGNIIFHAHEGFDKLYPRSSIPAIIGAAELGFQSCVVIPKFTADGVPVCFHNDGTSSSKLSSIIKMPDGTAVPDFTDTSKISDFTYAELAQWSIGYYRSPYYADCKLLKMDDFLRICAETGMRPIFSIHPDLTMEQWAELKLLLDKYKLTKWLSVKSGDTANWKKVIDTFGDGNIYSIINIVGSSTTYDILSKITAGRTSSGAINTRIDVEFFDAGLKSATYGATQLGMLSDAVGAGYVASVVLDDVNTGAEIKNYMQLGVTEFTNCKFSSIGLNW